MKLLRISIIIYVLSILVTNVLKKRENDPPTSPASSSSSPPFHGFDNVSYADHYEKDDTIDERLKEFNDNALPWGPLQPGTSLMA